MVATNSIKISLTEFVDFMCKAGKSKISQVKTIKKRQDLPYSPARDFYKPMRDGIKNFHKFNKGLNSLDAIWTGAMDVKKRTAYPNIITGYRRFLSEIDVTWVKSPRANSWIFRNLEVRINPELCLAFGSNEHIIKLYFKKDRLSRNHALSINHLMQTTLGNGKTKSICGVLDVRNSNLIEELPVNGEFVQMVNDEATNFLRLYNSV